MVECQSCMRTREEIESDQIKVTFVANHFDDFWQTNRTAHILQTNETEFLTDQWGSTHFCFVTVIYFDWKGKFFSIYHKNYKHFIN